MYSVVWRDRVVSLEFSQLRRIPQVAAIVVGADRAPAIAAAIRGRLLKSLIIDETGANALPVLRSLGSYRYPESVVEMHPPDCQVAFTRDDLAIDRAPVATVF